MTRLLLQAGANPDHASNIWLDRAIHIACHEARFYCQNPILIEYGADASASSRLRDSPLAFDASRNFAITVEALFKATSPVKHTKAVVAAINSNALNSLRKLMELGADCHGIDASGRSILHYAAIDGKGLTLELLANCRCKLPRPTADSAGYFPTDYVATRSAEEIPRSVLRDLFETEKVRLSEMQQEAEGLDLLDGAGDDNPELQFENAMEELGAL